MNTRAAIALLLVGVPVASAMAAAPLPVLQHSDVVFMYQASREIYQEYGATVLAWGGTPKPESLASAQGLKFFGSVGMVTEFGRYYNRFPDKYEQGLCRDLQGKPYKVPWLTDHQHKGTPFWWCCTRQPLFRQYITERVVETVKAGAHGVHIDDHLGTAGSIWTGGCFCDRCATEFKEELKQRPAKEVSNPEAFDYPAVLRPWLAEKQSRKVQDHPLWHRWRSYQLRGAAQFMAELRETAAKSAGRAVPMSANAGLLWGPHLNDFQTLDFFSAEIDHHASALKFSSHPLVAYRIAEAVDRPLASTASGQDWAFVKEKNLSGIVQGWIALGYAAGHSLMAPNRQWCYTKEKGTHWYNGPKEKYAPLYRFVRANQELFDDYRTYADVTVVYAQKTFDNSQHKLLQLCQELTRTNISYSLALGGDDAVPCRLDLDRLRKAKKLAVLEREDFLPEDEKLLASLESPTNKLASARAALNVNPAVQAESGAQVLLLPRVKPGAAVVHVLNWHYDGAKDDVQPLKDLHVRVDYAALGLPENPRVTAHAPGKDPEEVSHSGGLISLPHAGLWTVLHIH